MNPPHSTAAAGASSPAESFDGVRPERWVEAHGDCLYRYALLRVHKREIAQDLVQETFLAAVRTYDKFGGRSSERSWLCGILKHKICDHFRRLIREPLFTDLAFLNDEALHRWVKQEPKEWKPDSDVVLHREEFWQILRDGLAKLPPRIADVFTRREMEGMETWEICESLSITQNHLWVMLHRARAALRERLEARWFEFKISYGQSSGVQAALRCELATTASMKAMPRTPSRTLGKSRLSGSGAVPSSRARMTAAKFR
jgi:RNA polymerase sigma-70 factor (TIGR02943 family)